MIKNDNYTEEGVALLPEQFRDATLLQALLTAYLDQIQDLEDEVYPIIDARQLSSAAGDRLDGFGQIAGVERLGRSDAVYRILIQAKFLVDRSQGTLGELVRILQTLQDDIGAEIKVVEYYPAQVQIFLKEPLVDSTIATLYSKMLHDAKPAGIKLDFQFIISPLSGIFRFSSLISTTETSSVYGFGAGKYSDVKDS